MDGPQRSLLPRLSRPHCSRICRVGLHALLLALLVASCGDPQAAAQESVSSVPAPFLEDAQLNDLCFVDATTGWAVGDRGAIWHTADGGSNWQRQASGVDCRLESVCFLDAQHGWVVGGRARPGTTASQGVLLRTRDGGRTWQEDHRLMLPALERVGFFDADHGWVLGDSSALFASAAFTTDNGGRSWNPLPTELASGWTSGDFLSASTGALAGRQGRTAIARQGTIEPARTPPFGQRSFRDMALIGPTRGWLVGEGGLILTTDDLGRTWQTPPGELPDGASALFHYHAVAARGEHCWIVGSPGTRVLRSSDAGRTWQSLSTGQQTPLHAVCFVDEQHGWAAGALGTILATQDGGQTWRRQRSGGTRTAVLGIYGEAEHVPLEVLVRLAGNEGYLTAIELLNRRQAADGAFAGAGLEDRAREAVALTGAGALGQAWQFPLPATGQALPGEQLISAWNRANDGDGLRQMVEYVVRQIRTWRPEIVLTHAASLRGENPQAHLINQVVLRAVEQAGDATAFPEHQVHAGLEPWQVKKVFGELPSDQGGPLVVNTAQFAPRLGRSLADLAAVSRALMVDGPDRAPAMRSFRAYVDRVPQERGTGDFLSGITLHPGGEARRMLVEPDGDAMEKLRRVAQKQQSLETIFERATETTGGGQHILGEIDGLAADLGDEQAGQVLMQLAARYHRTGKWDLAAETLQRLADQYPEHRLAPAALQWLVQAWASGEVAWQLQQGQRVGVQTAAATMPLDGSSGSARSDSRDLPYAVRQTSALGIELAQQTDRRAQAVALGEQLLRIAPAVHAEPAVGFPLSVAQRDQGQARLAERIYGHIQRNRPHDAWWACAEAEKWLVARQGLPPKPFWQVAQAGAPPQLDGILDEALWRQASPVELKSPLHDDHEWHAVAMLTYDREYLYLGLSCRKAPGADYAVDEATRERDADLSSRDRVELLIDVDRDWSTYFRLVIDCRGWAAEDCWGDSTWNPEWFIAVDQTADTWQIEAALPWSAVAAQPPTSQTAWSVGLQRTVPGVGFQSWNTPAAVTVRPEGFGLLLFD